MKKSGLQTWLYSSLGVAAVFIIVLVVNALGSRVKTRIDLTQEKAYTLSKGTRAILAKLDTPIQIRFYTTRGDARMPVQLKAYAQHVEDLLGEYRQASKGQIEIQKLDPEPDSDAEDSAKLDGIEPQQLQLDMEPIYLGLSISMLDQKEALPFLSPERERLLEYDLSRAISRVMTPEKPTIGIMSSLQPAGMPMNPMMMRMGQRGAQPWVIYSELKRDFNVKTIEMTADTIPDDVKVLVVIHPKGITDAGQYAIDQFVLRGGKLLAMLDPMAALDRSAANGPMGMNMGSSSTLDKLLKAWGLTFDSGKVVADMNFTAQTREGPNPAILLLNEKAINRNDVITADANNVWLYFAGGFTGTPAQGLTQTVLLHSTGNSQLIDGMSAQFGGRKLVQDFTPSNTEYALALRLNGKFKTAFPEGKPKAAEPPSPDKPEDKDKDKDKDKKAGEGLKESKADGVVVLIGDSDFVQDQIAVEELQNPFGGGGQRMIMPKNGNLAFAQAAIEQLTGDENLITVRSRASRERPFTVVNEMQAKAESAYRSKIKELETSLSDTQSKLNQLQQSKQEKGEKGQRFILSPEQQAEITNFRKKETEVKTQLKEERKNLRGDIDSLQNRIKWLNIALMPFLVTCAGVGLAVVRHQRRAAR